jgi:endonuclease YncB( thermonuclease family)
MKAMSRTAVRRAEAAGAALACALLIGACSVRPAIAAGCAFEPQGEGRVAAVIDARTFRLDDGREVRLAGVEPATSEKAKETAALALSAIVARRQVTLRGEDDTPDRYGRQPAFVFVASSESPVQALLLSRGEALVSAAVTDKECALVLTSAENSARDAKQGVWADAMVIKNAESPGDILAATGRFLVVEGRVLSVRQAGATTYVNFGRNWTRDFAVTIPKRMLPTFEAAGVVLKSLENQRIRVRGWVEARSGPRIEVLRVGQIEVVGGK